MLEFPTKQYDFPIVSSLLLDLRSVRRTKNIKIRTNIINVPEPVLTGLIELSM